jgi:hypothetical protein
MARKAKPIPQAEHLATDSEHLYKIINEESDLACALIVGSSLEMATTALVGKHLVDAETAKGLLSDTGPLGTFRSCTNIAYCLGLISKGMFNNLNLMGEIRNVFAHSNVAVGFDNSAIGEKCRDLTFPEVVHQVVVGGGKPTPLSEIANTPRSRFTLVGTLTFNGLLMRAMEETHKERRSDMWDHPRSN